MTLRRRELQRCTLSLPVLIASLEARTLNAAAVSHVRKLLHKNNIRLYALSYS